MKTLTVLVLIAIIPIGLICFIAYFSTKATVCTLDKVYTSCFKKEISPVIKKVIFTPLCIFLIFFIPAKSLECLQINIYKQAIPPQIELENTLFHDEISDFIREGCGIAIFKLSNETLKNIKKNELVFLKTATVGRKNTAYNTYSQWQMSTSENKPYMRGYGCIFNANNVSVKNKPRILKKALEALNNTDTEKSFFTTGPEKDLTVIPSLGILIFSHNG